MSDVQAVKYRVIGALVIVVFFTVAWWLLLDKDSKRFKEYKTEMPKTQAIERFSIEEPKVPESLAGEINDSNEVTNEVAVPQQVDSTVTKESSDEMAEKILSENNSKPADVVENKTEILEEESIPADSIDRSKPITSALDSNGLPQSWVLQLASVKNKANADALKDRLLKNNYPAYVKTFHLSDGETYRVLVGPKLSQVKAAEMAMQIKQTMNIKDIMVKPFTAGYEE